MRNLAVLLSPCFVLTNGSNPNCGLYLTRFSSERKKVATVPPLISPVERGLQRLCVPQRCNLMRNGIGRATPNTCPQPRHCPQSRRRACIKKKIFEFQYGKPVGIEFPFQEKSIARSAQRPHSRVTQQLQTTTDLPRNVVTACGSRQNKLQTLVMALQTVAIKSQHNATPAIHCCTH